MRLRGTHGRMDSIRIHGDPFPILEILVRATEPMGGYCRDVYSQSTENRSSCKSRWLHIPSTGLRVRRDLHRDPLDLSRL